MFFLTKNALQALFSGYISADQKLLRLILYGPLQSVQLEAAFGSGAAAEVDRATPAAFMLNLKCAGIEVVRRSTALTTLRISTTYYCICAVQSLNH